MMMFMTRKRGRIFWITNMSNTRLYLQRLLRHQMVHPLPVDSINQETSNSAVNKHDITIAEAFLAEKREEEVIVACHPLLTRLWRKQQRTQFLLGTVCVLATALAITLGITHGKPTQDELKLLPQESTPPAIACNGTSCLGDWAPSSSSSSFKNGCCSGTFSGGMF